MTGFSDEEHQNCKCTLNVRYSRNEQVFMVKERTGCLPSGTCFQNFFCRFSCIKMLL